MKIFISWSGERSRIIAEGLNSWLPKVIQAVKPFYSPEIEKGTKGIEEINKTLEGTSFGIICLTPDNRESSWIHYEAGALSKIEGARIWTLLYDLKPSDIVQPLAQFQHTLAKKADIYNLLVSLNAKLPEPLDKSDLSASFERWWSDFEETLKKAERVIGAGKENQNTENIRSDREILNETLGLLRNQQSQLTILVGSLAGFPKSYSKETLRNMSLSLIEPETADLINKSEYIGFEFTVLVIIEQKTIYRQIIESFLLKLSPERMSNRILDTADGFEVRIIFELPFDLLNLIEYEQSLVKEFGNRLKTWNPILLEDQI